ncbi:hypothetical protein FHS18_000945 [Paenibacillus phyllosphaerae]|uniref:SLH domain-containing protein n=1 Tax=Paenibacillus phyllosphaerae TaxID=274593 RepID=A0A7W5AUG8_9BACL|nr:S-layer homology domain-containing protein [Paenibacillus phyllosphaerae]MBB3108893.1 hypothetical protein [Paenibacillus phyllosphaerae]
MKKWNKAVALSAIITTITGPIALAAGPLPAAYAIEAGFKDQTLAADWAQDALLQLKQSGIMEGDDQGNFRPADRLTRAEFASVLAKLLGLPIVEGEVSAFTDVPKSSWAQKYIAQVSKLGLMNGNGSSFRPQDPISREEVAVTLVRVLGVDAEGYGNKLAVTDADDISNWAKDAVQYLLEAGIMQGNGTGFEPKRSAARQEIAVIIAKAMPSINVMVNQSISEVRDGGIVIGGAVYTVAESLKGLFLAANDDVLRGAVIRFENTGRTITKVTRLEITASGKAAAGGASEFSGNLSLQGNGVQIDGDLVVGGDYISIHNLSVTGNFELANSFEHDFYAEGLQVGGMTGIHGGDSNTVVFQDGKLNKVDVNKADVHVEFKGNAAVAELNIQSNASVTADGGVSLPKVSIAGEGLKVELNANVEQLDLVSTVGQTIAGSLNANLVNLSGTGAITFSGTGTITKLAVTGSGTTLTLSPEMTIGSLALPDNVQPGAVITNYADVQRNIGSIGGGTPVIVGGGSSVGGSSGGGTVDSNHAPEAKSLNEQVHIDQIEGVAYAADELATDADGDTVTLVPDSAKVSDASHAEAWIDAGKLWIKPLKAGATTVTVQVTDGAKRTTVSIPVDITDDPNYYSVTGIGVYGALLTEYSAGTEAVFNLAYKEGTRIVAAPEDGDIIVKLGEELLVLDMDYSMADGQLVVSMGVLDKLPVGVTSLSIRIGNYIGTAEVTVYEMDPILKMAVASLNAAAEEDAREILVSDELGLQLTPFNSLPASQQESAIKLLLDYRATGYVNKAAIQDSLDQIVYGLQMGGTVEEAVAAVNNAASVQEMLDAISTPLLHLDNEDYSSLEDYELDIVAQYLIDHKNGGYANRDGIQTAFNEIVNQVIDDWYTVYYDLMALEIGFADGDSVNGVTQDLILPSEGPLYGSRIEWASSHPDIIAADGKVVRPNEDTLVTLTVTVLYGYEHISAGVELLVKAAGDKN